MSVTVYADVGSPLSYLVMQRAERLSGEGRRIDWRLIERPSASPTPLQAQVDALRYLIGPGDHLPVAAPPALADATAAVSAYATAYATGNAARTRRILYYAYWIQGLDIGDTDVLRLLFADLTRPPVDDLVTLRTYRRIRDWRSDWTARGGELPLVIHRGRTVHGVEALRLLDELTDRQPPENKQPNKKALVAVGA